LEVPPVLNMASDDFFEVNRELYAKLPDLAWRKTWTDRDGKILGKDVLEKRFAEAEKAGVWPLIEKALHADRGPTRWGKIERGKMPAEDVLMYVDMGRFMEAHAIDVARRGQPDRALNEATKLMAYGRNMAHASSDVITFMGANVLCDIGIRTLRELTKEYSFSEEAMRKALADFESNRVTAQIYKDVLRGEFVMAKTILNTDIQDRMESDELNKTIVFFFKISFKKNATTKDIADFYRTVLALPLDENWDKELLIRKKQYGEKTSISSLTNIANFADNMIMSMTSVGCIQIHGRYLEANSFFSAAQTALAVRLYQAKHNGSLPDTLEELVREGILPSVPLDYMDGRPIRYSKELRIVWTIGMKKWNPPFLDSNHKDFDDVEERIFRL
jgi:hypothetical protein